MKVVIGTGNTKFEGWFHTQKKNLNLLSIDNFKNLFPNKDVECFLAEHVWEHLTYNEGLQAARNCYQFLKPGGYLRIAVPDKNFRNKDYQNIIKIGGPGPKEHPAYTHKIVYDYKLLTEVLNKAGFKVNLLEYCDEFGKFHFRYWNPEDGYIGRSLRFDSRNSTDLIGVVSIIIDAYKEFIL